MRPADRDFAQLVSKHLPRLSAVIHELREPFYAFAGAQHIAENTVYVDWGFERRVNLRYIREPQQLYGLKGEGRILWECYGALGNHEYYEIRTVARYRDFTIKPSTEFHSWLKKRMLALVHLPPAAGLPALEASLHRLLSPSPTPAARPAEKAQ